MSKQVSLEELDEARSEGRLVVDVRDPQEYSAGHIPSAQLGRSITWRDVSPSCRRTGRCTSSVRQAGP